MMLGTNIRMSKVSVLFVVLLAALFLLYIWETMFSRKNLNIGSEMSGEKVSLLHLLVASVEAAKRGGQMVKLVKSGSDLHEASKGKTKEGVKDPVTLGDMLSHEKMYFSLLKMFPNVKIVSEEKSDSIPDPGSIKPIDLDDNGIIDSLGSQLQSLVNIEEVTVWIDPLDATHEYTENLLQYVTTMVCVAHKGEPVIGVIHQPFKNHTIWAWKGHGRSSIPEYQTLSDRKHFNDLKIIVSRKHKGEVEQLAKQAFGKTSKVTSAGGAGYKALNVAQRKFDAYVHMTAIKKWDICAGHALLRTVGGEMTDLRGKTIDYFPPRDHIKRSGVKLDGGLVATFQNHNLIVKKLKKALVRGSIKID